MSPQFRKASFTSVANNRPIFMTSLLSGVGSSRTIYGTQGVLSTTQFAYLKGLGTCDTFCMCGIL